MRPGPDVKEYEAKASEAIEHIRSQADLAWCVGRVDKTLRPGGAGFIGTCPREDCHGKNFHLNTERQLFYCFDCGAGGNAITYFIAAEGKNFLEAVIRVGELVNEHRALRELPGDTDVMETIAEARRELHELMQFRFARAEALKSLDRAKILAYCARYGTVMPEEEEVFWIAVHKARTACLDLGMKARAVSKKWLLDRGYEPLDDGEVPADPNTIVEMGL